MLLLLRRPTPEEVRRQRGSTAKISADQINAASTGRCMGHA